MPPPPPTRSSEGKPCGRANLPERSERRDAVSPRTTGRSPTGSFTDRHQRGLHPSAGRSRARGVSIRNVQRTADWIRVGRRLTSTSSSSDGREGRLIAPELVDALDSGLNGSAGKDKKPARLGGFLYWFGQPPSTEWCACARGRSVTSTASETANTSAQAHTRSASRRAERATNSQRCFTRSPGR